MYPPSPLMNAGKCGVKFFFLNNVVSEGRGEFVWCPKFFVRDYKLL